MTRLYKFYLKIKLDLVDFVQNIGHSGEEEKELLG